MLPDFGGLCSDRCPASCICLCLAMKTLPPLTRQLERIGSPKSVPSTWSDAFARAMFMLRAAQTALIPDRPVGVWWQTWSGGRWGPPSVGCPRSLRSRDESGPSSGHPSERSHEWTPDPPSWHGLSIPFSAARTPSSFFSCSPFVAVHSGRPDRRSGGTSRQPSVPPWNMETKWPAIRRHLYAATWLTKGDQMFNEGDS